MTWISVMVSIELIVWLFVVELTSIDVSMGSPINKGDAARFPGNQLWKCGIVSGNYRDVE